MPLHRLARLNRTTVFLVTIGVLLLALFLPGWYGAVLIFAIVAVLGGVLRMTCLLYTSPSPRDRQKSRMPSSA